MNSHCISNIQGQIKSWKTNTQTITETLVRYNLLLDLRMKASLNLLLALFLVGFEKESLSEDMLTVIAFASSGA